MSDIDCSVTILACCTRSMQIYILKLIWTKAQPVTLHGHWWSVYIIFNCQNIKTSSDLFVVLGLYKFWSVYNFLLYKFWFSYSSLFTLLISLSTLFPKSSSRYIFSQCITSLHTKSHIPNVSFPKDTAIRHWGIISSWSLFTWWSHPQGDSGTWTCR